MIAADVFIVGIIGKLDWRRDDLYIQVKSLSLYEKNSLFVLEAWTKSLLKVSQIYFWGEF